MKGGRGLRRVAGREPSYGLLGRKRFDLDPATAELLDGPAIRTHPRLGPTPDDEPLRKLVEDVIEIVKHESVPVAPPPVRDDAPW